LPVVGFGNFRPETHGVLAVWFASLGMIDVYVSRDKIIFKVRESSASFKELIMEDWMPMWIAYEDAFLFSRVVTPKQALEVLDKMPE